MISQVSTPSYIIGFHSNMEGISFGFLLAMLVDCYNILGFYSLDSHPLRELYKLKMLIDLRY